MSLLAAQYGTVSDIEVVWTIIAFIGIFFSFFNIRNSLLDRAALKKSGEMNGRWLLANYAIRAELARAAILVIFLTIGILAMFIADPPSQLNLPPLQVAIGLVFRWGLVISGLLITLKSYWAYELRNTLIVNALGQDSDPRHTMKSQFSTPHSSNGEDLTQDLKREETRAGSENSD